MNQENWIAQINDVFSDTKELLEFLNINTNLTTINKTIKFFPLRVPKTFAARMEKGNINDPLLKQVMISHNEFINTPGFLHDPLKEHNNVIPCLLHKYFNRAILLVKGKCAINCRYCFRRYFPYARNKGNLINWRLALNYIFEHQEIDEIILSGGDPLIAKDSELDWLISKIESISHIKKLRIHSRLPMIIPSRINNFLIARFTRSNLKILLVNHINHVKEISNEFGLAMNLLKKSGVTLLNQSVLLRGINDNAYTLANLSNALFDIGVMPYYLHTLDRVQGTSHFLVNDHDACRIINKLTILISGYLVPKLVKNVDNKKCYINNL